jgi:hypothetical protein
MNGSSIIAAILPLLILRHHVQSKSKRLTAPLLGTASTVSRLKSSSAKQTMSILGMIIDAVQYHVFCRRVEEELGKLRSSLNFVGLECKTRFNRLGGFEGGKELVDKLATNQSLSHNLETGITGEALVRIDAR